MHQLSKWKQIQRQSFTSWQSLADYLQLNADQRREIVQCRHFPLLFPRRLADKVKKETLNDPILKQFLPTVKELADQDGFTIDAVGDENSRCAPKLLHKYTGRVLLVCTSACAMHCRYCFRQHFEYDASKSLFKEEVQYIEKDASISEVILSGGDPLSLSDEQLGDLLERISTIPHIRRIRFHTRFPIGIPERIDDHFLSLFEAVSQNIIFVIHVNHPLELDQGVISHLDKLRNKGFTLLCQTVLLQGVNDEIETLSELCEKLVNNGVIPYYLHQLDRVKGASHFEVGLNEGKDLIQALEARLPGYAVPRYVQEIAGEPNKVSIL